MRTRVTLLTANAVEAHEMTSVNPGWVEYPERLIAGDQRYTLVTEPLDYAAEQAFWYEFGRAIGLRAV